MPTAPIIRGNDEPQLQRIRYTQNASTGGQVTEEWKGGSTTKMTAKWNANVYLVQGAEMTFEKDVAELRLIWGGSPSGGSGGSGGTNSLQLTIDRWEVPEPKTEKPRFNHPTMRSWLEVLASLAGGTASTEDKIINYLATLNRGVANNAPTKSVFVSSADGLSGWDSLSPDGQNYIKRAYQAVLQGQTHYQSSQYSLRHTTNTPNYWSRNVADNNVNRIYTQSQLIAECTDSNLWYFPLPGRLQYKLAASYADFAAQTPTRANYQIGWLKSASSETTTGRSRNEIQTGFVLDQWPLDVYPLAT